MVEGARGATWTVLAPINDVIPAKIPVLGVSGGVVGVVVMVQLTKHLTVALATFHTEVMAMVTIPAG